VQAPPNQLPESTPIGAGSSAVAVHAASRRVVQLVTLGIMARPFPQFTREAILRHTQDDIAGLERDFANKAWMHEMIPLLRELHSLVEQPQVDQKLLADLETRSATVLRKHRLKGFDPILWMIASLRDTK
jgi:hypothetical protein